MYTFTEEELNQVRETMDTIGVYLPEHLMPKIWGWYRQISGSKEPQPCSCKSAAGLWVKAVDVIRNYITELQNGQS